MVEVNVCNHVFEIWNGKPVGIVIEYNGSYSLILAPKNAMNTKPKTQICIDVDKSFELKTKKAK